MSEGKPLFHRCAFKEQFLLGGPYLFVRAGVMSCVGSPVAWSSTLRKTSILEAVSFT